jgi:hypothetical protein
LVGEREIGRYDVPFGTRKAMGGVRKAMAMVYEGEEREREVLLNGEERQWMVRTVNEDRKRRWSVRWEWEEKGIDDEGREREGQWAV